MSISPSLVPSRTSGVAPLAIFFDASATTSTDTTRPFHDIYYKWNFGDTAGGAAWTYGTRTDSGSKNVAYGPLAAHVFETPGTYTVTLTVYDGATIDEIETEIVATDPATVYAQRHFFSADTTYAVGTPADNGTTVFRHDTTSDFDAAVSDNIATNRALYFERDDSFAASAAAALNVDGPWTVGGSPYGAGARPIITGAVGKITLGNSTNHDFADGRIVDLDLPSAGGAGIAIVHGGTSKEITILRCDVDSASTGIQFDLNILETINNPTKVQELFSELAIVECDLSNSDQYNIFGSCEKLMLLGNRLSNAVVEHGMRTQYSRLQVLSSNEFGAAARTSLTTRGINAAEADRAGAQGQFTFAGSGTIYTELSIISDNKFIGGAAALPLTLKTVNSVEPARFRNHIYERNWMVLGATTLLFFQSESDLLTVRNNIVDLTACTAAQIALSLTKSTGIPDPADQVFVYNNTVYSGSTATGSPFVIVDLSTAVTNLTVKNNLGVAPDNANGTTTALRGTAGTGLDSTNNSTLTQIQDTSPLTTTPPTEFSHWVPAAATYPIDGGAIWAVGLPMDDFLRVIRLRTGATDMGALTVSTGTLPSVTVVLVGSLGGLG